MIQQTLTNEQQIKFTLTPTTLSGKPAQVENPSWTKLSGDCTHTASEDGLSCMVRSSDTPGVSQFLVEADADLDEGVEKISDIIQVTVEGAKAANLGITAGTPEIKD